METNKLVLTINYDKVIKQCTIHKDYGGIKLKLSSTLADFKLFLTLEFSNMQWIQLALKYHNGHTAFYADDQLCEIEGKHELSDTYIAEWVEGAELGKFMIIFLGKQSI